MTIPVGALSYAAAAAAFLFLSVLLVASWQGRFSGVLLAAASGTTVAWAGAAAYIVSTPGTRFIAAEILEIIRMSLWLMLLLVLVGYRSRQLGVLRGVATAIIVVCAAALLALFPGEGGVGSRIGPVGVLLRLLLAVAGMVLVEQLYRNVHPQQRWGVKYLCLGLGGIFACDFYLYSDALLFRRIDPDIWAARGFVNALAVPALAVATARNPTLSLDVTISRRVVFHSAAMLGTAAYLLVMALAGYYIRYFGGTWGTFLQVTFLFGAAMLLGAILFSGTLRARLRVFVSKNFFRYRYDYREEWLRFTRMLSEGEPGAQLRERSVQAIAELVESPAGALWLAGESGAFELAAHWNMPLPKSTIAAESAFVAFLERRQWVIDLHGHASNPEAYDLIEIPESVRSAPQAWLVVPLILHERLQGFVVLASSQGRISLNWEVNDLLKTAGRQAASYLAQLEAARALLIARQFESFNRMSAFVVHDLKNLIAQLSLLVSNAERHKHDPEFQQDMIETVANSVEKMNRLLFQLRGGYSLDPPAPVSLPDVLRQIVSTHSAARPVPRLDLQAADASVLAQRVRLERVIGHLVQNAIDATAPEGSVLVRLLRDNADAIVEISDTGCGMNEDFVRNRLFRPFESTKTSGMGIGTYETQEYVRAIGGRIDVESRPGHGTTFRVTLPVRADELQPASSEAAAVGEGA